MIAVDLYRPPIGAALLQGLDRIMDIVFHLGVHRTGCTTFQAYLRDNACLLDAARIACWGPDITRHGLFRGLFPKSPVPAAGSAARQRAEGRVGLRLDAARKAGLTTLLVSDQRMIGSLHGCLRARRLYPAIGERMARLSRAFGSGVTRIALSIRSPDRFWTSALAQAVGQGGRVPDAEMLADIAASPRSWRDVITDLACAVPSAEIRALPFESFYADPITLAHQAAGLDLVLRGRYDWLDSAPDLPMLRTVLAKAGRDPARLPDGDGPWQPFAIQAAAAMRERYADDLLWLAQGAGGLAGLTEEAMPRERGQARRAGANRGHEHDRQIRLGETG